MELSFCDLRAKEVINICDGCRLGNIVDLVFDCFSARITGLVVPFSKGFFSFLKSNQDIFIPWNRVLKIGKDVILVELTPNMPQNNNSCKLPPPSTAPPYSNMPLPPYPTSSIPPFASPLTTTQENYNTHTYKSKTANDTNINLNNFDGTFTNN